jgi:hypothetical protein
LKEFIMLVTSNIQAVRKAALVAKYEKRVAKYKCEHALSVLQAARKNGSTTLIALAECDNQAAEEAYDWAIQNHLEKRAELAFAIAHARSETMYRFNSWGERVALWWDTLGM